MVFIICRRFNLIESKETDVLRDLEIALRLTDDPAFPQQPQQQQQQPSSLSSSESNSQTTLLQSSLTTITTTTSTSTTILAGGSTTLVNYSDEHAVSLIDGDASIQPICTQPESGSGQRSTIITSTLSSANTTDGGGVGNNNGGDYRGLNLGISCSTTTSQSATHSDA